MMCLTDLNWYKAVCVLSFTLLFAFCYFLCPKGWGHNNGNTNKLQGIGFIFATFVPFSKSRLYFSEMFCILNQLNSYAL